MPAILLIKTTASFVFYCPALPVQSLFARVNPVAGENECSHFPEEVVLQERK